LYIIESGIAKVFTNNDQGVEIVLAKLGPGDFFGEQALLSNFPLRRNANVLAFTDVYLIKVSHEDFKNSLNINIKLVKKLSKKGCYQAAEKVKRQISVLKNLPSRWIENLDGKFVSYSNEVIIFNQGDKPDYVYFILSGNVNITIKESNNVSQEITLKAGQLFGELGVINNTPRKGTAKALGKVKLFKVKLSSFKDIYNSNQNFRELLTARENLYNFSKRDAVVSITDSLVLGLPALRIEYNYKNSRVITASRAFDRLIFSMQTNEKYTHKFIYNDLKNLNVEIGFSNNKIVSVVTVGLWKELGLVCGLLLDETPIETWRVKLFNSTGTFGFKNIEGNSKDEITCYCMNVTIIEAHEFPGGYGHTFIEGNQKKNIILMRNYTMFGIAVKMKQLIEY
ncbi:cyclic nucleotide-binding domain-containing protein, partial [Gammaproteobacteria bacterium]|nr:cyclic nucleotide-binding domain-containing protein [Gammaproteobacteria bacterium]